MPIAKIKVDPPAALVIDTELRSKLLNCYLEFSSVPEINDWLRGLKQATTGGRTEKVERIRANTKYLSMPPADFPQQTIHYLDALSSDQLAAICEEIGIDDAGNKWQRWRRILRHVALSEGWLSLPATITDSFFTLNNVLPFVQWHTVAFRGNYENEFYDGFFDDMAGFFGAQFVHHELPVASGTSLRIDFHLGHPQKEGVGIEFKMPTTHSELQKAMGQIQLYQAKYKNRLVVILLDDFVDPAGKQLFLDSLSVQSIPVLIK
jgi:hypothetical protein